jgi:nucleotide-binding universal stress UspA family protein
VVNFKRILFPVDFSARCKIAARYVASYARRFEADVTLLHVEGLRMEPHVWQPQTEPLARMLDEFLVDEFAGLKVQRHVTKGDPAHEIVNFANNARADLVMLPTHGRGQFRRFVLGSVMAKVLHDIPCPVWTTAHLDEERLCPPLELTNVLCAVDLDDTAVHIIRYAANFARRHGARLTVAHAVPAVETLPEFYTDVDLRRDFIAAARGRLGEMQAQAGCEAVACFGAGNIARFVSHAAQSHKADLVIIGRGEKGVLGRLRTHHYAIIRECECPVLSI